MLPSLVPPYGSRPAQPLTIVVVLSTCTFYFYSSEILYSCAGSSSIKFWRRCRGGTVSYSLFRFTFLVNFLLRSWCTGSTRNFCCSENISGPGLCSRKQSQQSSDLLHSYGNLSELLTYIFAGSLNCKTKILQQFISLFISLYLLSNLNSKMMFVKY